MDLYVFVTLCAFTLIMGVLGIAGKRIGRSRIWALFAFMGAFIGIYTFLGLGADGFLSIAYAFNSNGQQETVTQSIAQIQYIPLVLVFTDFGIAIWSAVKP
jgi:hypothetical protein